MIPLIGSAGWDRHLEDADQDVKPCPKCGGVCGDGDRVHYGMCGRCVHFARKRRVK